MPTIETSRKTRFKAALQFTKTTQVEWARQNGVGYQHLYLVLEDERESRTLTEKIDAFIAEVEAQVMAA